MSAELKDLILRNLVRHRSRNEIVRSVCEQAGLNWAEGERLVRQVEQEQGRTIARRQSPFLIFLSVGTLVIGCLLVLYSILFFIQFFQAGTVDKLLSAYYGYYRIAGALTGLGMIVGGLLGLWRTLRPLLEA